MALHALIPHACTSQTADNGDVCLFHAHCVDTFALRAALTTEIDDVDLHSN